MRMSSVKRAVETAHRFASGIAVEIQHMRKKKRMIAGQIIYKPTVVRFGLVKPITKVFRDNKGVERVSRSRIAFFENVAIDLDDKLILPSGQTGPLLEISSGLSDKTGEGLVTFVTMG